MCCNGCSHRVDDRQVQISTDVLRIGDNSPIWCLRQKDMLGVTLMHTRDTS
jgi:hypothetical protein